MDDIEWKVAPVCYNSRGVEVDHAFGLGRSSGALRNLGEEGVSQNLEVFDNGGLGYFLALKCRVENEHQRRWQANRKGHAFRCVYRKIPLRRPAVEGPEILL